MLFVAEFDELERIRADFISSYLFEEWLKVSLERFTRWFLRNREKIREAKRYVEKAPESLKNNVRIMFNVYHRLQGSEYEIHNFVVTSNSCYLEVKWVGEINESLEATLLTLHNFFSEG